MLQAVTWAYNKCEEYKFERLTGKGKIGPHTDSLRLQLHYDQTHQQGYGGHSWSKDKSGYNVVDVQFIARLCVLQPVFHF